MCHQKPTGHSGLVCTAAMRRPEADAGRSSSYRQGETRVTGAGVENATTNAHVFNPFDVQGTSQWASPSKMNCRNHLVSSSGC